MEKRLEAITMLFVLYTAYFVKALKGSTLDKSLTDKERDELFEVVSQSISQTINDIFDKSNEEKNEGDRKDA